MNGDDSGRFSTRGEGVRVPGPVKKRKKEDKNDCQYRTKHNILLDTFRFNLKHHQLKRNASNKLLCLVLYWQSFLFLD